MLRLFTHIVLLALLASQASAQPAANDPLLIRLTTARYAADFKADRASLDTLLAPDVAYGRSSGVLDTKAGVLKEVGPGGPYQLDYLTPDSLRARRFGNTGVVNGIVLVKLSAQKSPYRIRFTDVWALRGTRWQLVSFQATRLPDVVASPVAPAAVLAARVRRINPQGLSSPTGYTHVVVEADGRTVHIAGQVALDSTGALVGAGDFRAQAERVFENLRIALASVGATFKDVVTTTTYLTDMRNVPALRDVRGRYYDAASLPTSTAVQVSSLVRPEWMIEIEAVAQLPQPVPEQ